MNENYNLIADLLKKECCIFIGAGIPNALGFPLWKKLSLDLISFVWSKNNLFKEDKLSYSIKKALEDYVIEGKYITAITYCRDLLKEVDLEKNYQMKIIEFLHDENKYKLASSNNVYIQIKKIITNAVVLQTNLDKSIEVYCKIPSYINTNLPETFTIPCLIYLHGIITDPRSWIITRDEYDKFYQRDQLFMSFIENIFKKYNVIFLGYSLSDKEILDKIAKVKGTDKQYILVLEEYDMNIARNAVFDCEFKHYNIQVIRYSIERNGFDSFSDYLNKIIQLLMPPVRLALQEQDGSRIDE